MFVFSCSFYFVLKSNLAASEKPACTSRIFCQGNLLRTVQMARIFNDSKTFVDMRMQKDEAEVLQAFKALFLLQKNFPGKSTKNLPHVNPNSKFSLESLIFL